MKKSHLALLVLFLYVFLTDVNAQPENKLFYNEPAKKWVEALPLGNGRLGAMVYGGVAQEQIQFNEETLWKGEPHNYSHKATDTLADYAFKLWQETCLGHL